MSLSLASGGGGGHEYTKFETEDVAQFRNVSDFSMPRVQGFTTMSDDPVDLQMIPRDSMGLSLYVVDGLDELVMKDRGMKCDREKIDGYRIQIFAGSSLENANNARADFLEVFDEIPIYQDWDAPRFHGTGRRLPQSPRRYEPPGGGAGYLSGCLYRAHQDQSA